MANLNIDANSLLHFALRWTFAGLWGAIGWAVSTALIIPLIPGI